MKNDILRLWATTLTMGLLALSPALAADPDEALLAKHLPDTRIVDSVEADVDGDGTTDTAFLTVDKEPDGFVGFDRAWIGAVSGKTGEWLGDLALSYQDVRLGDLRLGAYPMGGADCLLARGLTASSISRIVAAVAVYQDGALKDLFADRALFGLCYDLSFADGPVVELTLENGAAYRIVPDGRLYLENGWIDEAGKLQPSLGNGFDENTGFANLEPLVSKGELVLMGEQSILGAHKLDTLATLKTAWRYDGQGWTAEAVLVPAQSASVAPEFLPALYYNPDGGIMFHLDFACPTVNAKYLPLERMEEGSKSAALLKPCAHCAYLYVSP